MLAISASNRHGRRCLRGLARASRVQGFFGLAQAYWRPLVKADVVDALPDENPDRPKGMRAWT